MYNRNTSAVYHIVSPNNPCIICDLDEEMAHFVSTVIENAL